MRLQHIHLAIVLVLLLLATTSCRRTAWPGPWLEYQRSGGIMGVNDKLTIYADGTCTVEQGEKRETCKISREEMDVLRRLADTVMTANYPVGAPVTGPGADRMMYTLMISGRVYTFLDGNVPAPFLPLLERLDRILIEIEADGKGAGHPLCPQPPCSPS